MCATEDSRSQPKSIEFHGEITKNDNDISDDIEYILSDIGGSYGKFQLCNYFIFSIPIMISGLIMSVYVFTSLNLDYR